MTAAHIDDIKAPLPSLYQQLTVLAPTPVPKQPVKTTATTQKPKPKGPFTREEVAKHNHRDDCWLIIEDKVYDVTPYIDTHMGGDAILKNAGLDSTKGFQGEQHPAKVSQLLPEFYIGELVK